MQTVGLCLFDWSLAIWIDFQVFEAIFLQKFGKTTHNSQTGIYQVSRQIEQCKLMSLFHCFLAIWIDLKQSSFWQLIRNDLDLDTQALFIDSF